MVACELVRPHRLLQRLNKFKNMTSLGMYKSFDNVLFFEEPSLTSSPMNSEYPYLENEDSKEKYLYKESCLE